LLYSSFFDCKFKTIGGERQIVQVNCVVTAQVQSGNTQIARYRMAAFIKPRKIQEWRCFLWLWTKSSFTRTCAAFQHLHQSLKVMQNPVKINSRLYSLVSFLLMFTAAMFSHPVFSQKRIGGVVADSTTRQVLPFSTIHTGSSTVIAGINGAFSLVLQPGTSTITVSYTGYASMVIAVNQLIQNDTIWLTRRSNTLGEVVIRPGIDKIKRIVNTVIRNKTLHNPEFYKAYQCNVYYRMYADAIPSAKMKMDTVSKRKPQQKKPLSTEDSAFIKQLGNSHLIFSEVFSRRNYRQPKQLQELVLASRFSGLKKTYFASLVTDVLPFHIYDDQILLNGTGYISPLAKGWQQRYRFRLEDELVDGNDTTFILSYTMRSRGSFDGLEGMVYISSNGYAVSHFTGHEVNISTGRQMEIEQLYTLVNDKWFPKEINYTLSFNKAAASFAGFIMNGHSVIDSVYFAALEKTNNDKTYAVQLSDSVDLRSEQYWQARRKDTLGIKERNTYRVMDSIFKMAKIEKKMKLLASLPAGRLALGMVDLELRRLLTSNQYEDTRPGLGLYTSDKLSKYFSMGGWAGYGTKDKVWKYGMSGTIFPWGEKDNWLHLAYSKDYVNAGAIKTHPYLDRNGLRNWLLQQPDRVEEYAVTAHTQRGYWELELAAAKRNIAALYNSNFNYQGKMISTYDVQEASLLLRYAYGEKRVPFFGYYLPAAENTGYPVVYMAVAAGKVRSGAYQPTYLRMHAGVTYTKHYNRWGNDDWSLQAGIIHTPGKEPLSRSFLFAGSGYKRQGVNFYSPGGFITMNPNDFYSDRYISLLYTHSFDKYLWRHKLSQPFISFAHNALYGSLSSTNSLATPGVVSPGNGYHESGIMLNRIVQTSFFKLFNVYLNAGAFYHWGKKGNWEQDGVWVAGLGVRF
jgi:Family of unknown function (DUF5686)